MLISGDWGWNDVDVRCHFPGASPGSSRDAAFQGVVAWCSAANDMDASHGGGWQSMDRFMLPHQDKALRQSITNHQLSSPPLKILRISQSNLASKSLPPPQIKASRHRLPSERVPEKAELPLKLATPLGRRW